MTASGRPILRMETEITDILNECAEGSGISEALFLQWRPLGSQAWNVLPRQPGDFGKSPDIWTYSALDLQLPRVKQLLGLPPPAHRLSGHP